MTNTSRNDAQSNVRLRNDLKQTIEEVGCDLGETVSKPIRL